jgi:uncharacterized protein YbdZ (MbtH family)
MSAKKIEEVGNVEMFGEVETAPEAQSDAPSKDAAKTNGRVKANGKQPFDPAQYLSNFDGRDYLEVKWRIMWLRSEHPDARIATEIVQHNEEAGFALFRAEVEIPSGGKSTGWGSETVRDFHDYIEAAETKALGRALASLGYGTQFCTDYDFSANARPGRDQVVDAPVNLADPRNLVTRASNLQRNGNGNGGNGNGSFAQSGFRSINGGKSAAAEEDEFDKLPAATFEGNGATEKQVKAIYAIGRASKRLSEGQVDDRAVEVFGVRPQELTKAEASQFIDMLKGESAAA